MKNIIKAFTLVELIVVIAITTVISASGVFYFLDFVQEQKLNQKLSIIKDNLNNLDKKVKKYEIFDYQLEFNTSNTLSYITYINNFDTENQILSITNSSWSWEIVTIPNTWSWIIKIYKNKKLFINQEINRNTKFPFNFNETSSYKITWTQSWEILNKIYLDYYSNNNLYSEKNDLLELKSINIQEDNNWVKISKLKIINIWWIKKFYDNWVEISLSNKVYLFFENNWKEKFIKITK